MEGQSKSNGDAQLLKLIVFVAIGGAIAWAAIMLMLLLVCMFAVAGIAGSGYLGYRIARDDRGQQNKRISKHTQLQAVRQMEKEYFTSQGHDFMPTVVDNHYDDQTRKLYEKQDHIAKAATVIKKVKDVFK